MDKPKKTVRKRPRRTFTRVRSMNPVFPDAAPFATLGS